jgi:hypothetical protein
MLCALEQRIKCLQEKDEDYTIEFQEFDEETNQPFIMVVITPLMKRVHKLVCSLFFQSIPAGVPVNSRSNHPPPPREHLWDFDLIGYDSANARVQGHN